MVESEWLHNRALYLQVTCHDIETGVIRDEKQLALLLRYESMHSRAFYKALNELQKLRNEKKKEQIGFVSQKRSAELHCMKQEAFEMKKEQFEMKKSRASQPAQPEIKPTAAESRPDSLEMAA
jgi:Mn-containing catalase